MIYRKIVDISHVPGILELRTILGCAYLNSVTQVFKGNGKDMRCSPPSV